MDERPLLSGRVLACLRRRSSRQASMIYCTFAGNGRIAFIKGEGAQAHFVGALEFGIAQASQLALCTATWSSESRPCSPLQRTVWEKESSTGASWWRPSISACCSCS